MFEPSDVKQVLESLADPKEGKQPQQEGGGHGHLLCASLDKDVVQSPTSPYLAVVNAVGQEDAEPYDECKSPVRDTC